MNSEIGGMVVQETGSESIHSGRVKAEYSSKIHLDDLSTSMNDNPNGVMHLHEKSAEGAKPVASKPPARKPAASKPHKPKTPKRKIAIVGTAESQAAAPYNDESWEIWGLQVGLSYKTFTRYNRLYEMHIKDYWTDKIVQDRMRKVPPDVDIWMQDKYPEIPNSKRYPVEEVMKGFHPNFTSSIAYMLAHAAYEQRTLKNIGQLVLYGVHMMADEEYGYQRAACEYWLGIIEALGTEVLVAGTGSVLKCTFSYGYDKEWKLLSDLSTRKQQLQVGLNELKAKYAEIQSHVFQQEGAIKDVDWTIRRIQ